MTGRLACALAALALAGCGDDEREAPATTTGPATATEAAAEVRITADEDGAGGARAQTVTLRCPGGGSAACAALEALGPEAFDPVPQDVACTELYGGPETARVTGEVGEERVDARFTRSNGCEIARYDAVEPLLSAALPDP